MTKVNGKTQPSVPVDPALSQIRNLDYSQYLPGVAIDVSKETGVDGAPGGEPVPKEPTRKPSSREAKPRTPKGETVPSPSSSSRQVRVSERLYSELRLFQACLLATDGRALSMGSLLESAFDGSLRGVSKQAWEMYRGMKGKRA